MGTNKITLFILDDNIPKIPEFVDQLVYNTSIQTQVMSELLKKGKWLGHHNLHQLTSDIINSDHSKTGVLNTLGFTHPSICLTEIEGGLKPDIIIYDWEYGTESNKERSDWLLEILELTSAFVFVYSGFRDQIPAFLNKDEFSVHSDHLQLFEKGNSSNSVFSSEEFILQYILSKITKANQIKIGGLKIDFRENGYLNSPSDILYLEKIFGNVALIESLKEQDRILSQESIERMVLNVKGVILHDTQRNLLLSSNATLLIEKYKPEKELPYLSILKKYGLQKLIEVLEVGIAKI